MSCVNCVYGNYPRIPATIPFEADIAVVGEAPGIQEIVRKKPFVGPSGQLLDKAMQATGLPERGKVYITNALRCKPPQKKPNIKTAIKTCRPRLVEELQKVNPKIVMVLGNIAMHAIMDDFDLKITREQGRALTSPLLPGTTIIPIIHPAAILRAPGDYKLFYSAMSYVARLYAGDKPMDPGKTQWEVIDNEIDVKRMIKTLSTKEVVSADIETTGLKSRRDKILVVGIAYEKNKVFVVPADMLTPEIFTIPDLLWVWHNGKFDSHFCRRRGLPVLVHHDTMLLSYCLNEHSGVHDLEQVSSRAIGAAPYKHKANKQVKGKKDGFASLDVETLFERVAEDADFTLQSFHELYAKVKANPHLLKMYNKLMIPGSAFLRRVERNGMYVYKPLLQEIKKEYQEHLDEIMDKILDVAQPYWDPEQYKADLGMKSAPDVFNPGSTYQVAWLLFDVLGLKPPRRKKRSTDKEVLEYLQGQHPIIDLMLEHRSVVKELSTYIIGVEKHIADDDRVHTTYKLHGTVTGRLSSSEPNVQNQPKRKPKVRNIFQAPPGKKFLEVDYKGAELRVLAHVSGDKGLTRCFVEGRDLHTEVAEALDTPRIRAKAVNFGIAYGRTEYSFAEEFGVSVAEARTYLEDWFKRFPQAAEYMAKCCEDVRVGKALVTPFGRHRRFGLITQENIGKLENEARNFVIQSVASDLTLISGMRAEKPLQELGIKIVNLVHDSILMECPDDMEVINKAIKIVTDIMTTVPKEELNTEVPFDVEFSLGVEWGKLEVVA